MTGAPRRWEDVDGATRRRLDHYAALLLTRNAAFNLTAARSPAAVEEHVRDSLTLLPYVRDPLIDVGSGGGFPAIPLAIATGYAVTAVEAVAKKVRFLRATAAELGLNLSVVAGRAEEAARRPDLRARFGSVTARGVGGFATVLELTVPFLAIDGLAVLQRGRLADAERTAGADAALMLGAALVGEYRAIPESDQRRIVLVRKVSPTAPRFPRRSGVPAKRPLGGARHG
ncbi:MAG: 16S rRNA (guanine(527)-N(7))-methyltransferase RsmG [Candidatus Eremiobacteraeota bacterium]|nr:16S rRNA (guanine(527)-N(7))-methyltransferase RsmG [Candidatus Eremiobacteraeota bacterium]MBC5804441.1 16S rRNA (guanine(527)-N(7))-methyltransferase RsmG [Candidatus Eremiobacteraeota bacterium]MBC5820775.1 16S rRNA (guanine(527)-N(7))-methyltransferase RsmG [Candidatus Eremiobacteraeota bacterium]